MQTLKQSKYCWYLDFFHYICYIDSENLCFIHILKEKILTFDIVCFFNFAPQVTVSKFNMRRGRLLKEMR